MKLDVIEVFILPVWLFFLQALSILSSFGRGFFTTLLIKYFFRRTEVVAWRVTDSCRDE